MKAIQKERKEKALDSAAMVLIDKREKEVSGIIEVLQRTRHAVTYVPPAQTDTQKIVSKLDKYILEKNRKVQYVKDIISENTGKIKTINSKLLNVTSEGDADAVISLSEELDQEKERGKYLQQMLKDTEAIPTFPDGTIVREWLEVCESKRNDWETLLQRIVLLADEYRSATDDLLEMNENLLRTRGEMKRIANEHNAVFDISPIMTAGINLERLKISKADGMKAASIGYAGIGRCTL